MRTVWQEKWDDAGKQMKQVLGRLFFAKVRRGCVSLGCGGGWEAQPSTKWRGFANGVVVSQSGFLDSPTLWCGLCLVSGSEPPVPKAALLMPTPSLCLSSSDLQRVNPSVFIPAADGPPLVDNRRRCTRHAFPPGPSPPSPRSWVAFPPIFLTPVLAWLSVTAPE